MSQSDSTVLFRPLPPEQRLSPEEKRLVRSFARTLGTRLAPGRPFTCVLADDAELRRLNSAFLGHDYPTDVLSFPSNTGGDSLGEMILSVERAAAQAAEWGHSRSDEIRILILHGLLHLCGMDHATDRGEMARLERQHRNELGLPRGLIARSGQGRRTA